MNTKSIPAKGVNNESIPSIAFDPKSPSTLLIAHHHHGHHINTNNQQRIANDNQTSQFRFLSCDDGTGCNAEETQCLMRLIDVHNNSFPSNNNNNNNVSTTASTYPTNANHPFSSSLTSPQSSKQGNSKNGNNLTNTRKLSQAYRKQIIDCIDQWEIRINDSMEKHALTTSNGTNSNSCAYTISTSPTRT